jgi:hypothetical protein
MVQALAINAFGECACIQVPVLVVYYAWFHNSFTALCDSLITVVYRTEYFYIEYMAFCNFICLGSFVYVEYHLWDY